jgi:hypothetical protein
MNAVAYSSDPFVEDLPCDWDQVDRPWGKLRPNLEELKKLEDPLEDPYDVADPLMLVDAFLVHFHNPVSVQDVQVAQRDVLVGLDFENHCSHLYAVNVALNILIVVVGRRDPFVVVAERLDAEATELDYPVAGQAVFVVAAAAEIEEIATEVAQYSFPLVCDSAS